MGILLSDWMNGSGLDVRKSQPLPSVCKKTRALLNPLISLLLKHSSPHVFGLAMALP
jgi:uncharacterized protein YukJ